MILYKVKRLFLLQIIRCSAVMCTLLFCFVLLYALYFLFSSAWPVLDKTLFFGDVPFFAALTGAQRVWDGLWPALVGTLCLLVLTMFFVLFPGLASGIFLAEYASKKQRAVAEYCIALLAGTPSILLGLLGVSFILFLRKNFSLAANTCLTLAASCLALLVLPTIVVASRQAIEAIPSSLRMAAFGLGFSKEQSLYYLFLAEALPGICRGFVLALARAAEDTAVIMLTGAVMNAGLPNSILAKFEALPFMIFYTAAQYQNQKELLQGFGTSVVLLCLVTLLLLFAWFLERLYIRRWQKG